MQETAESVKEYGVLVPALARPRENGGYELIAGTAANTPVSWQRSEERRVGKECRSRWSPYH